MAKGESDPNQIPRIGVFSKREPHGSGRQISKVHRYRRSVRSGGCYSGMGTVEHCPYSAQSGTERNTQIGVASRPTASRWSLTHHRNGALIASRPPLRRQAHHFLFFLPGKRSHPSHDARAAASFGVVRTYAILSARVGVLIFRSAFTGARPWRILLARAP